MNSKKIIFPIFILMALVQLYVPAKMIWDREEIIATGIAYKFKTAPIDPNDPFRGKYVSLSYDENSVVVENKEDWKSKEDIYVYLTTDADGFAKIKSVSKEKPTAHQDFLKAKVYSVTGNNKLTINYPFDRFYMEESKAYDAELMYRKTQIDSSKTTYALVKIKDGEAVLKDVLIDGISIREIVKANRAENKE